MGAVLEYRCDSGYVPDGPNILACTALGRWSSDPPHCIRSDGKDGLIALGALRCVLTSIHRYLFFLWTVCLPPYQLENGGYTCHPSSCGHLSHGTVVEYFCDEGYILKGDYKYLTCQYGEWDSQLKLSCLLEQGKQNRMGYILDSVCFGRFKNQISISLKDNGPRLPLGMPALSIVASTASSVALILFLVVLFVLLQPRLKSLNR